MTDAGIILGGRAPNVLASVIAGTQGGQQALQFRQQNALNGYLQENGPAVMRGEQNALNGLSQFGAQGLEAAMGVQDQHLARENTRLGMESTRLGMERTRQQMRVLDQQQAMAVQEQAAALSAQQRAEEAARAERAAAIVLSAETPEQFDALANKYAPQYEGQFGQRDAIAAQFLDIKDVLEMGQGGSEPAGIQALRIRAQEAGLQPGTPEYQQFMASGGVPSQSTAMRVGADGTVEFTQGTGTQTGGNGKSLTVDEGKNTGFLIRAQDSQAVLDRLEGEGTKLRGHVLQAVPFGLGNFAQTDEFQQYDQARRDFINAILRRESGAVISDEEFENAEQQYFPQPGDSLAVIAQKRRNRENQIEGLRVGSGDGVNRIDGQQQPTIDFSTMDAGTILQQDLSEMSAADLAAYMARMDELGL